MSTSFDISAAKQQARISELETALRKAADTFNDIELAMRMMGRPLTADSCAIALADARRVLDRG